MRRRVPDAEEENEYRFETPWYEWKTYAWDYVHMLTAHGDSTGESSGNCRFDFVTPTSNMQLHTLVASLANGVRLNYKQDCSKIPTNAADMLSIANCVNEETVQSDVMAFVTTNYRRLFNIGSFVFFQSIIIPSLSMIWFPVMTTTVGYEKKRGLLTMMRVQSLEVGTYWVSNYVWFFFLYGLVMCTYFALFHEYVEVMYDYWQIVQIHLLWGHSQIGIAFVLSAIFSNAESLTGVTYFFMIMTLV